MAKVIGHRDPKLRLSYFEAITLKRLAEHARKKEEEEFKVINLDKGG